ncbi:tryptophan halogenase family protein [Pseudocolwellia sp. HL-MZ7]|uniref:tryptophan halogenase family protein n=1 Tax=Pseudocolwellia sp. HL-MZ7 TaxID=3400627 RepID=UPI003CEA9F8A
MTKQINNIVILGGGTAGWMTAAALSKLLNRSEINITLVESEEIPSVGVGEATIPQLQLFNALLGIDENEFVIETQATFKHGIMFKNWKQLNHDYIHPFGSIGIPLDGIDFYQYWLKLSKLGKAESLDNYAFNSVSAINKKMMRSINVPNSPLNDIAYAFHFDAGLYAKYLNKFSMKYGVNHIISKVNKVNLIEDKDSAKNGFIRSIELMNGQTVEGDLFIDCSGFHGVLIEQALHTGYESWSHWLPCDRAVVMPTTSTEEAVPYTCSTAHTAGWQWKIPLQSRVGNGHVYSSRFMSDDEAKKILLENVTGEPLTEPRVIHFKTGVRRKQWNKNCVAIGLSSGFIEPLESTSIHLIQSSISRLMSLFPSTDFDKTDIDTFNRQSMAEQEAVRDFIIAHYKITERDDSAFWNYCRNMDVPSSVQKKIDLFKTNGRVFRENNELFHESSWVAVMVGQGLTSKHYHPLVDAMPVEEAQKRVDHIKHVIEQSVMKMPTHTEFIQKNCKAAS